MSHYLSAERVNRARSLRVGGHAHLAAFPAHRFASMDFPGNELAAVYVENHLQIPVLADPASVSSTQRPVKICIWQEHGHLLTAITRNLVTRSRDHLLKHVSDFLQALTTRLMPVRIVIELEAVDMDPKQCQRLVDLLPASLTVFSLVMFITREDDEHEKGNVRRADH